MVLGFVISAVVEVASGAADVAEEVANDAADVVVDAAEEVAYVAHDVADGAKYMVDESEAVVTKVADKAEEELAYLGAASGAAAVASDAVNAVDGVVSGAAGCVTMSGIENAVTVGEVGLLAYKVKKIQGGATQPKGNTNASGRRTVSGQMSPSEPEREPEVAAGSYDRQRGYYDRPGAGHGLPGGGHGRPDEYDRDLHNWHSRDWCDRWRQPNGDDRWHYGDWNGSNRHGRDWR